MSGTVLVTGGASGIGLACVEAARAAGWRAVAADRDAAALARVPAGADLMTLPLDVADEAAVVAAVARVEAEFGPLAGVVNSAGIAAVLPLEETGAELFRKILDVNVVGSFLVAREAVKAMLPRGRGAIVHIASVSGIRGNIGRTAYGASKGAVITMTKVMASELGGRGIRVNAIAPGPIETPLTAQVHDAETRRLWGETTPMRRYGTPAEIAAAAVFLLDGAKAAYITGQVLAVDGGFSAAGLLGRA
jgi:NAD(P)-dependent dehydrogenase (short-subunit alcohol dehydrogenase family)